MDENKDMLTTEDAFTENAVQDTESNIEQDFEQYTDLNTETDEVNVTSAKNKKAILQLPIIIAIIIVAVTAAVLLVFKCFFNQSIVGTWSADTSSTASADEATTSDDGESQIKEYFVFKSDGQFIIKQDSMDWVGTYKTTVADDGTKQLIGSIQGGEIVFNYEISGNAFTGRELTLTNTYNDMNLTLGSSKVETTKLEPDKDFKPNDKIVGSWKFDNGITFQIYTFNDDGTAEINQADMLIVDGIYTYNDTTITFTYHYGKEVPMEITYEIDDKGLKLNDFLHTKVDPSAANETNAVTTEAATKAAQ